MDTVWLHGILAKNPPLVLQFIHVMKLVQFIFHIVVFYNDETTRHAAGNSLYNVLYTSYLCIFLYLFILVWIYNLWNITQNRMPQFLYKMCTSFGLKHSQAWLNLSRCVLHQIITQIISHQWTLYFNWVLAYVFTKSNKGV